MRFQTDGLIIRETNIGEQNRVISVLTASNGIISAFVNNARNIKSPKGSSTRLLCYSRLGIFQSRDKYIIDTASAIEMFIPIRNDFEKMALSQYFCQLAGYLSPKEEPAGEYLKLILNALYILTKNDRSNLVVKSAFELRMLTYSGYMPDLVGCVGCGCYEGSEMFFLPKSGSIICSNCLEKSNEYKIPVSMGVLTAMRHCIYADVKKLFSFTLPKESLLTLEKACEDYMSFCIEQSLPTLDFYHTVREN